MKFRALVIGLVLSIFPASGFAHTDDPKDKERSQKMERTMAVDSAVSVSVCVMSGNITVRGWDKNEVQARSADAVQIELKRVEPVSPEKTRKLEVVILNKAETPKPQAAQGKCQAYSDVELNIPRGATVVVQTRDGDIDIAEIASAYVGTQNGDISVEQISHSIEVGSIGGSICIKDSSGRMSVTSAGGPVEAVNIRPLESGDAFEVTTVSGDITLEGVTHKQLSTTTVSGNVNLTGPLTNGGRYGFNSFSGDITLAMPADSSFRLSAKVSEEADIITDFPLTITTEAAPKPPTKSATPAPPTPESPAPPSAAPKSGVPQAHPTPKVVPPDKVVVYVKPEVKVTVTPKPSYNLRRVNAICGTGEAAISVSSFSGTLRLQHN
jgi:putative adhesin